MSDHLVGSSDMLDKGVSSVFTFRLIRLRLLHANWLQKFKGLMNESYSKTAKLLGDKSVDEPMHSLYI